MDPPFQFYKIRPFLNPLIISGLCDGFLQRGVYSYKCLWVRTFSRPHDRDRNLDNSDPERWPRSGLRRSCRSHFCLHETRQPPEQNGEVAQV